MLTVLRHSFTPRIIATFGCELLALLFFLALLPLWLFAGRELLASSSSLRLYLILGFVLFNIAAVEFSLWSFGLYSRELIYRGQRVFQNLLGSVLFAGVLLLPLYGVTHLFGSPLLAIPVQSLMVLLLGYSLFLLVERYALLRLFDRTPYLGNVLILGSGAAAVQVLREVRRHHGSTVRLIGILTAKPAEVGRRLEGCPVVGQILAIRDHVDVLKVDAIVVALPPYSPEIPAQFLLKCQLAGIQVLDAAELYESTAKKLLLEQFSPVDFLYRRNLLMTRCRWLTKSLFEKGTALLLLVPATPVMALAALLVKLTSPGPVLYRQRRVGQDGKVFTLLKFRSMVDGAEKGSGAVWARPGDPRVTAFGKLMRKTRIDELPQLFNILRSDMSIVGPRPERPEFVDALCESIPHYAHRHLVKPGLTGWAQVAFRYGASLEDTAEKLRYDLYYIKHMSLGFDALIIINTVRIVLFQSGAR
jgi:sugar transferase (PEP-CTERM system associated)